MALRLERATYRPDRDDYAAKGGVGIGLRALRRVQNVPLILTPCPPRNHCHVCETRLDAVFGSADKTAKYQHQAREAGQASIHAIRSGLPEAAYALARRAGTYALLAATPGGR